MLHANAGTKSKKKELCKPKPAELSVPGKMDSALKAIAHVLSAPLAPSGLAEMMVALKDWTTNLEEFISNVRGRLIDTIKTEGAVTTDAGTRVLEVGEWSIELRPHRTGHDPKKIEALLRAKGYAPQTYMDTVVTHKVRAGVEYPFTPDELATCKYDESWALQTPKRRGSDE